MEKKANPAFERYLLQTMTPEEQQTFQNRLATEPGLAAELAFYEALWLNRDAQLKARWATKGQNLLREAEQPQGISTAHLHSERSTTVLRMIGASPYRWAVAATFALLVVAAGIWYSTAGQDPAGQVYAAQYERLSNSNLLSAATATSEQQTWNKAFSLYQGKNYKAALGELRPLNDSPAYRDQMHLLAGACHLEQNRPQDAIREFQQVNRAALSLYNRAQFNIALAYLRARDEESAREQLQKIASDPESSFRSKAMDMLREMPAK